VSARASNDPCCTGSRHRAVKPPS